MPFPKLSISSNTVDPEVEKPDIDSKRAPSKLLQENTPPHRYGNEPMKEQATHDQATIENIERGFTSSDISVKARSVSPRFKEIAAEANRGHSL